MWLFYSQILAIFGIKWRYFLVIFDILKYFLAIFLILIIHIWSLWHPSSAIALQQDDDDVDALPLCKKFRKGHPSSARKQRISSG